MKSSILLTIFALMITSYRVKKDIQVLKQDPQGFAVVELFTSEGCPACPPADSAVLEMSKQYKSNVFFLGFHVDYWDQYGWKDKYSDKSYSRRQEDYGSLLRLKQIYNPQIIVNGKTELLGSDKEKLQSVINQELGNSGAIKLELNAKVSDSKTVITTCTGNFVSGDVLNVAIVQMNQETDVTKGDNAGKHFLHLNIVRGFKTVKASANPVSMVLPDGVALKDCKVIAFLQKKSSGLIVGAASVDLAN
ncbi:MAG: DUF1223 domain-containing protein [Chitinophagales bacterium]